jgi:hypothetical protein
VREWSVVEGDELAVGLADLGRGARLQVQVRTLFGHQGSKPAGEFLHLVCTGRRGLAALHPVCRDQRAPLPTIDGR